MSEREKQIAERLLTERKPETQYECCKLAAEVSAEVCAFAMTDEMLEASADGLARGLFGEAFDAADQIQRRRWTIMCKTALLETHSKKDAS